MREAMLRLLAETPLEQIQITDLTARAGVGYATFFRHFSGIDEVLSDIASAEIEALLGMTIPVLQQFDSSVSMRTLCRYVFDRQALWRTLLTGGAAHTVRAEFIRQAREWSSHSDAKVKTAVPIDLGTVCAAGSTIDALAWWLERIEDHTVDEIAEYINELVINPFIGGR